MHFPQSFLDQVCSWSSDMRKKYKVGLTKAGFLDAIIDEELTMTLIFAAYEYATARHCSEIFGAIEEKPTLRVNGSFWYAFHKEFPDI